MGLGMDAIFHNVGGVGSVVGVVRASHRFLCGSLVVGGGCSGWWAMGNGECVVRGDICVRIR